MDYAVFGVLGSAILSIINHDILYHRDPENESQAHHYYWVFLVAVLFYFATDVLWGLFRGAGATGPQYAATVAEFVAMALAIVCWVKYVVVYLEQDDIDGKILVYAGNLIFAFQLFMLAVNFVKPVFFTFDAGGRYQPGFARYLSVGFQIIMFFLTAVYTIRKRVMSDDAAKKKRLRTIGSFGFAMALLLSLEMFFPNMPLYTAGYMIGICLMHSFVIEDELGDYISDLEDSLSREKEQMKEIVSAQRLAHTDPLTGIKNKLAYIEKEKELNERIEERSVESLAVAVFDLNGLKEINDTRGHEVGDRFIIKGCKMICDHFKHSPVFRIGGDEFVAVLEGSDFEARESILMSFNDSVDRNIESGDVVVSAGISEFVPGTDTGVKTVFDRADQNMYERKRELKLQS